MSPIRIYPGTPAFLNLEINAVPQALPNRPCTHVTIKNDSAGNLIVSRGGTQWTMKPGTEHDFAVRSGSSELSVATAEGDYNLEAEVWG